jgi:hypothetical protein
VIVRISNEAQYEVPDELRGELNELDNRAVAACGTEDEGSFRSALGELLGLVRSRGRRLADEELTASELILPPPDISLQEAAAEFSGEGLIPE